MNKLKDFKKYPRHFVAYIKLASEVEVLCPQFSKVGGYFCNDYRTTTRFTFWLFLQLVKHWDWFINLLSFCERSDFSSSKQ